MSLIALIAFAMTYMPRPYPIMYKGNAAKKGSSVAIRNIPPISCKMFIRNQSRVLIMRKPRLFVATEALFCDKLSLKEKSGVMSAVQCFIFMPLYGSTETENEAFLKRAVQLLLFFIFIPKN